MDMKRFFLFAIVIAALTLAGCGGNGGGTQTAMPDPTPTPDPMVTCPDGSMAATMDACPAGSTTTEEMALKDARDAAMAAYMMAMGYADSAKDYVAMGKAQKYADMAKGESDMAVAATTSAMAEENQMKAEMYRDNAQGAAMTRGLGITMLANKIVNQQQIENAELEGKDPVKPRSNAKRVGEAMKSAAARPAVATDVPATVAGSGPGSVWQGSSDTEPANNTASANVTLDAAGAPGLKIMVTRGETIALTAGEEPKKLKSRRGDWQGTELVHTVPATGDNEAGMTYVNAYTDIQPPTQAYNTAAIEDITEGAEGVTTPTTSVVVAGEAPGDGSNFEATVNINPTDNVPPVMGRFQCAADASCSISLDASGRIVESTGYTFHKSTEVTTQDSDYLAWGFWLTVPGADTTDGEFPEGATTAGVFASGSNVFVVNAALKGKATYNGVATGLYSAAGMVEAFDADVMLEANFGGKGGADSSPTTAADNDGLLMGAVTGTVSNINAGGMAVDGSLMLLRATALSGTAATPSTDSGEPSTAGFVGVTDGILGGMTYRGDWRGQFYGPNKATTDMAIETEFPTTAAGTFGAAAENGASILGAFGSWKAE